MRGKFKDLTGQRFDTRTVIRRDGSNSIGAAMWIVRCDCGKETRVRGSPLITGRSASNIWTGIAMNFPSDGTTATASAPSPRSRAAKANG